VSELSLSLISVFGCSGRDKLLFVELVIKEYSSQKASSHFLSVASSASPQGISLYRVTPYFSSRSHRKISVSRCVSRQHSHLQNSDDGQDTSVDN
jgi:hypothetical protein